MSILNLFFKFTLSYAFSMGTASFIVGFFGLDDTGFITLILLGISWWCLDSYSVKNSRIVEGKEKWKLTGVVLAGSVLVEFFLLSTALFTKEIPLNIFLITNTLIIIPTNLLTILLAHWAVKKEILIKRKAQSTSKTVDATNYLKD